MNLRKHILNLLTLFLLVFGYNNVYAQGADRPLMVIRFSDVEVNYKNNLIKAVKMAIAAKKDVFFDIVAISPELSNKAKSKEFENLMYIQAKEVAENIIASGVEQNMLRTTFQKHNGISANEIRIYVQ